MRAWFVFSCGACWGFTVHKLALSGWRIILGTILVTVLMELLLIAFPRKTTEVKET